MSISATHTVFNAPYGIDETNTRMWLRGNLAWAAGNYATGGITPNAPPYLDASGQAVLIPSLNVQPDEVTYQSVSGSGYTYKRKKSTGKIQIFQVAGFTPAGSVAAPTFTGESYTPAGTNSKPSFTVKNGTILANGTIGLDADAASANVTGGTGITADRTLTTSSPVGTPTFTGSAHTLAGTNSAPAFTGTAVDPGPLVELPATALPAAVVADIIEFCATFAKA